MLGLADVAGVRRRRSSGGLDGSHGLSERLLAAPGDGHASTQSGEQLGSGATDAGASTRDERRTAIKGSGGECGEGFGATWRGHGGSLGEREEELLELLGTHRRLLAAALSGGALLEAVGDHLEAGAVQGS